MRLSKCGTIIPNIRTNNCEKIFDVGRLRLKKGKNGLNRYGRYQQINDLMQRYAQAGDITFAIVASKLRQKIAKPYNLALHIEGEVREYSYPSTIGYKIMMDFYKKAKKCSTWTAVEELEKEHFRYAHVG